MQPHLSSPLSSNAPSSQALALTKPADSAAPSNATPTVHTPTTTAPSQFSAMAAPVPKPVYDNDDDDEDMSAWVTSLVQRVTETDVTQTDALQKCFRDVGQLREALARGASLEADPAAASSLGHALHGLVQELVRHVQAGVVDLRMGGPDMICAICSGLGFFAELRSTRLIGKRDQASLPALLAELSAALAEAAKKGHTAADASDIDATLALLTWLSRALKTRLLYEDDKALRAAYSDGLACMRDWAKPSTGDAAQCKPLLNSHTLAICFVQINTIQQYRLMPLEGDASKAKANRAELQQLLKSLCATVPSLLSGNGVHLANVCNTLKDFIDAGLLPDSTDRWLMPCIALLLQRMQSVPQRELMQRGGQTLANYANFLRVLAEAGVPAKASFVGCAAGYRDACDWLTNLLGSKKFPLKGKFEQSLANLMSYVKAMSKLADRTLRVKEPGIVRQHWTSLKLAAQRLIGLAQVQLSGLSALRLSPMSISGMLLALWDFEGRGMATPQLCRPLVQRLITAIPNCAGTEWEGETVAMCLRAVVHLHAQQESDASGMREAFEHLLHLLGKHAVGSEVHKLYCLQALRLGLQEKWAAIDAPPLQKALRRLLAWGSQGSPGTAELEAAIGRLAHREEAKPVLPDTGFDEVGTVAEPDAAAWTPPGGKLAAVTTAPQLKPSTTYRAPTDTASGQQTRLVSSTNRPAAKARIRKDINDDDNDHAGEPMHEWFLLSSGRKGGEDALTPMQSLCSAHPELLNAVDAGGNHALHYAIIHGQQALARWLMAQPTLALGMPRDAFLERLAEGMLDSTNARQAKALYAEFKAAGEDTTGPSKQTEQVSAKSDHSAGTSNKGKASKRTPGQTKGAKNRRVKRDSDWDEVEKIATGNLADVNAPTDPEEQFMLAERYLNGDGVTQSDKLAFEWFDKAAQQGHPSAQHSVGAMYMDGRGTRKNNALAFQWMSKAAMQRNPMAQQTLAHMYAKGIGTKPSNKLAFHWLCQAADNEFFPAQYSLGINYREGRGGERNPELAYHWLSKAAAKGMPNAQYLVGVMYELGEYVEKNPVLSFEWFTKAAAQGVAEAQLKLGLRYRDGIGCGKDMAVAFKWFSMAAAQGLDEAQFALALMYRDGDGVEKNIGLAAQWLSRAAAQGNPSYQYELGVLYLSDGSSLKRQELAFHWISKAAAQGWPSAEGNLGAMYQNGIGVKPNAVLAFEWTRKAAMKGLVTAQYNLAGMYKNGRGVEQDLRLAFEWTSKAAAQGMPAAQFQLGMLYREGQGVEVNLQLARMCFSKAYASEFPLALAMLEHLEQLERDGSADDDRH